MNIRINIPNFARKSINYGKAIGISTLMTLSACEKAPQEKINQYVVEHAPSTTTKLISILERGDRHSTFFKDVPDSVKVISASDKTKYEMNDSVGNLFYQVYAGKADRDIRKATQKSGELLTVGPGITGLNQIKLAGNKIAQKGDYISATSIDSIMDVEVAKRDSIVQDCVSDSLYKTLKRNELDAVIAYLFNVSENLLKHPKKGKSFFEYLNEGNKGMVQSKFNVSPSAKSSSTGLAKRNIVQILIFGNGKIYKNAMKNFLTQVDIVKQHKDGKKLLKEAFDIAKQYGIKDKDLTETQKIVFDK
jgi:hypothetical protein